MSANPYIEHISKVNNTIMKPLFQSLVFANEQMKHQVDSTPTACIFLIGALPALWQFGWRDLDRGIGSILLSVGLSGLISSFTIPYLLSLFPVESRTQIVVGIVAAMSLRTLYKGVRKIL